ncbi:hypothetical protein H0H81_009640 [Sphagnurus paluster]|uniref:Uncharacterized protein n=1 Tax=Sphagnurus paluster TaxID=117069 RepID=A0A9P7FPB3_9AGAR|nr:hypothetical protein H0H81_009640 [Sphagnurus paluster]
MMEQRDHGTSGVLSLPELLGQIFGDLPDKQSQASALQNVDDREALYGLLQLIAPWSVEESHGEIEQPVPKMSDWERFMVYGAFVRSLTIGWTQAEHPLKEILNCVAATRPNLTLFPRLHSIKCIVDTGDHTLRHQHLALFLHPGIERITIDAEDSIEISSFNIPMSRVPRLCHLEIQASDLSGDLVHVIRELPALETLSLPEYSATIRVVEEISQHASLQRLTSNLTGLHVLDLDAEEEDYSTPEFAYGPFAALKALTIAAPIDDLLKTLTYLQSLSVGGESDIRSLALEVFPSESDQSNLSDLFEPVRALNVDVFSVLGGKFDLAHSLLGQIKPLLSTRLTTLKIENCWGPMLTLGEIKSLAQCLPHIETLFLHHIPANYKNESENEFPSLDVLPAIRKECPRLQRLGVCLDADNPSQDLSEIPAFDTVLNLHVGVSQYTAPHQERLCIFLALCNCEIVTADWDEREIDADRPDWSPVITMVSALKRMKAICVKQLMRST